MKTPFIFFKKKNVKKSVQKKITLIFQSAAGFEPTNTAKFKLPRQVPHTSRPRRRVLSLAIILDVIQNDFSRLLLKRPAQERTSPQMQTFDLQLSTLYVPMYHRLTSQAELDIYEIMRHFSKIYKVSEKFSHLEKNFQPYKIFFFLTFFS